MRMRGRHGWKLVCILFGIAVGLSGFYTVLHLRAVSTITYVPNTIGYSRISNVTFKPRGDQQSQPQDVAKNSPNVENVEKSVEDKYGSAVVILTYMRSGSSLVGDILQQSPGAFYVFEPFRAMWYAIMKANYTLEYMDGTSRKAPVDFIAESVDNLRQWLTCNTSQMYKAALHDVFLKYGKKSSTFKPCFTKEVKAIKTRNEAMKICADKLQTLCRESPIRIIKTIRLPMMSLAPLLEEIPGLKVLHLVRDPRPTLASQKHLGNCRPVEDGGDEGCTNRQCSQVENNILPQEELTKKYPGRLKTVTYESIAGKPLDASSKMYTFLGTTFSKHAEEYIYNITMAGNEDNCIICTTRTNSTEHVDRWKKSMKLEFIKIVQRRCNYILQHFGYELLPLNETTMH